MRIVTYCIFILSIVFPTLAHADAKSDSETLYEMLILRSTIFDAFLRNAGHSPTTATHIENIVIIPARTSVQIWYDNALVDSESYNFYLPCKNAVNEFVEATEFARDKFQRIDRSPWPSDFIDKFKSQFESCGQLLPKDE